MRKLPFAKDNRDCERGWAVTFTFCARVLTGPVWPVCAAIFRNRKCGTSLYLFPISRGRLHNLPRFVFRSFHSRRRFFLEPSGSRLIPRFH